MTALMDADIAKVREYFARQVRWGRPSEQKDGTAFLEALSRIAARIEELEGALKPFVMAESRQRLDHPDTKAIPIALGDLRRARAALAQEKADG